MTYLPTAKGVNQRKLNLKKKKKIDIYNNLMVEMLKQYKKQKPQ